MTTAWLLLMIASHLSCAEISQVPIEAPRARLVRDVNPFDLPARRRARR